MSSPDNFWDNNYDDWGDNDSDRPGISYNTSVHHSPPVVDLLDDDSNKTVIYGNDDQFLKDETEHCDQQSQQNSRGDMQFCLNEDSDSLEVITENKNYSQPTSSSQEILTQTNNFLMSNDNQSNADNVYYNKTKETKEEKERKKLERDRLREEKKVEQEREKRLKASAALMKKILKPEEAIKRITVSIDIQIVNSGVGSQIIPILQRENIKYLVEPLTVPNTIIWKKVIFTPSSFEENKSEESVQIEEEMLEIVECSTLISLVAKKELLAHVTSLQSSGKKLTLITAGLEKFRSSYNSKINKAVKSAVMGTQQRSRNKSNDLAAETDLTIDDIELALCEIQLLADCCHRNVENAEQIAMLVFQMTKSISQKEFKQTQYNKEKDGLTWYAQGDNKSCIKVDKNGNGLKELWRQQISQFNNVAIEVSQAIALEYPSPQALLSAYKKCQSVEKAAELLQDIVVRRDAGILSSARRVGPELSKKVHRFLTSSNPSAIL